MFCVYILKCADGTFYTGATKDLERRIAEHNAGKASKYTRIRLPVELHYTESTGESWGETLKLEAKIKKYTHRRKAGLKSAGESQSSSQGE